MSKIKSALYPLLQKAKYAKFISLFEKAKELPMQDNKILMYSTTKGRLGGNLLAIKNYIEKNNLNFDITVAAGNEVPSSEKLAAVMAQSRFILVDDYEPLVYVLKLRKISILFRFGMQWARLKDSVTAERVRKKIH